jgi:hypothetical protein
MASICAPLGKRSLLLTSVSPLLHHVNPTKASIVHVRFDMYIYRSRSFLHSSPHTGHLHCSRSSVPSMVTASGCSSPHSVLPPPQLPRIPAPKFAISRKMPIFGLRWLSLCNCPRQCNLDSNSMRRLCAPYRWIQSRIALMQVLNVKPAISTKPSPFSDFAIANLHTIPN